MSKRYLILAEGRSGDPHYGKTARGVIRYAPDPVVAILDSTRAGRDATRASRSSRTVEEALPFEPTTALVGVATQGGRFPPAWRELLKQCDRGRPRRRERPARVPRRRPRAGRARRASTASSCATCAGRRAGLNVPTGENLQIPARIVLTVGSDCAIGKMTVALELDREARRRGLASVFVPTGQTGIAIAGWGIAVDAVVSDFLAGAAERLVVEGARARRRAAVRRGPGLARASGVLGRHARADPRLGAARVRALPQGRARPRSRATRATRSRRSPSSSSCTSGSRCRAAGAGRRRRAQHARARRGRGAGRDRARPPRRPGCRRTTRSGSAPGRCSTPCLNGLRSRASQHAEETCEPASRR